MLYFFYWNSHYLIKQHILDWKNKFISKYGDFNCIDIKNLSDVNNNFLAENISAASFLNEKKLIIISLDSLVDEEQEEFLLKIIQKISEENIVVFYKTNPDKRTKFIKKIIESAKTQEFNSSSDDNYSLIHKKYWGQISTSAIHEIIKYKWGNIWKIYSEIEKLLITKDKIEIQDIQNNIIPELEESIFLLVDNILNKDIQKSISLLHTISEQTNIYQLYSWILSNLKNTLYIWLLKWKNISHSEINKILQLKNKAFLIDRRYKISFNELKQLYINLINIDKLNKSGKLLDGKDTDFLYKIEQIIIKS